MKGRTWVALGMALTMALSLPGCRSKHETDSYLVIELLQRKGLIYWYTPEQREILRQEVEHVLRNK